MQDSPRRLRRLAAMRLVPLPRGTGEGRPLLPERRVRRRLRAIRRMLLLLLWTAIAVPLQAVLLAVPGPAKVRFARFYWQVFCRLLGMSVRVIGVPERPPGGRPVVFVSNHSSWLDIPVLGARLQACFVSKDDVAEWPVVRTIARLGRTVFVSRRASNTARERDDMARRLADGDNLILFPEGTSSDGCRVLPFRSSFFAVAEGEDPPLIQPVSLVYDRLAGLPAGRATRPIFAWYGDMDLASHAWRLAQFGGMRATVLLHAPLEPAAFASRKALAQAAWTAVADGASTLRQNRPARPLAAPVPDGAIPGDAESPLFA